MEPKALVTPLIPQELKNLATLMELVKEHLPIKMQATV